MLADVIWPALLLEGRILTWWAIITGLVVEYLFVRRITNLPIARALLADIVMNAVSTLLGMLAIPFACIVWEFFPGIFLYKIFNIGTFNPGTWTATIIIAAGINALIEGFVLRRFFKQPITKSGFWLLFAANAISVGLAFGSLLYLPPRL